MAGKPFDVASKQLIENHPGDWIRLLGLSTGAVRVISADLATVTTDADRVLRVDAPRPYLAEIELQVSWDPTLLDRLLRYNILLRGKHKLPVESVIVLLRSDAERNRAYSGEHTLLDSEDKTAVTFRCRVLRVWEQSPEVFLNAGPGALPLAPLAKVTKRGVPAVLDRIEKQLQARSDTSEAATLRVITGILMGLRFDTPFIESVLKESNVMEESSYYQYIIGKGRTEGRTEGILTGRIEGILTGRAEEARELLVKLGTAKFGAPDDTVLTVLNAITNLDRLESLAVRLLTANSWADLLSQ